MDDSNGGNGLQGAEETVKRALGSPRTPPIVLAVGSGIWRLIAFWSNVDFILSVREERIAMILEALLDWGWIVIIFSGIVWAFFAPRTVTDKTKVNAGLAVAAAVLAFMGGILITTQSRASVPNILTAWGSSFQDCGGQVDTTKLVGFKNKYHLVMVCGVSNPRVDPYEDTQIAITTPFTITGQLTTMDTGIGKMSEILDAVPVGTGVSVWHSIALLPMSVEASEIKRVSDFEKRGGIVVTDPKAGGFQQTMGKPVPPAKATEVPPTSSPKQ